MRLGLELRDEAVHLRPVPAQPDKHALDENDYERHGDHVPDDRRRQRQRIIKTEGDAVGQPCAQLHNGQHGYEKGRYNFPAVVLAIHSNIGYLRAKTYQNYALLL